MFKQRNFFGCFIGVSCVVTLTVLPTVGQFWQFPRWILIGWRISSHQHLTNTPLPFGKNTLFDPLKEPWHPPLILSDLSIWTTHAHLERIHWWILSKKSRGSLFPLLAEPGSKEGEEPGNWFFLPGLQFSGSCWAHISLSGSGDKKGSKMEDLCPVEQTV